MEKQIDLGSLSPISPITQHDNDDSPNSTLHEHNATIRQHDDPPHSPISQNVPPHSTIREHDATIRQLDDPPHSPIGQNVSSHSTIRDHNATIRQHDDPPHSPISQNVPPHSTIRQHDDSPTSTIRQENDPSQSPLHQLSYPPHSPIHDDQPHSPESDRSQIPHAVPVSFMEQLFNTLCRHVYENAFFTNQILLNVAQNLTEVMNTFSIIKRSVEGIAGVEGGINVTGIGAMEQTSSGLGEERLSAARGIGNWSLGLGRVVGGTTNTSASGGMGDGWRAMGGLTATSTSTGMGDGSLGYCGAVGGVTNTCTFTGLGDGSLGFCRNGGMGDGSLNFGRVMGGAINAVGEMGDWSLALSRAMGEVSNNSNADGLVGGLNVPEVEEGFGGPMSGNSVTGSGGNDQGSLRMGVIIGGISVSGAGEIGVGMGGSGLEGLLGHVREGTTSAGRGEDVMRTRSVDDLYALAKSQQHFAVLLVRKLFSREQCSGRSAMGGKLGKLPLDREILGNVKALYFQYYPSEHKEEDWKRCITAINTYLRSKACKKNL